MKALITGITGFAGSHLAELLLDEGVDVYGTIRWRSRTENIDSIQDRIKLENADIRDASGVGRVIKKVKPDYIFHLAAQSYVPESWNNPLETLGTNVLGCANVLEAVRQTEIDCTVHVAGSSEEYGFVYENEIPIKETNPLRPMSPYGVSKVAQDLLACQYHMSFNIETVVTRAFNHTGPRRGQVFATSTFAKQVAEIEKGKEPIIHVGNLDAIRDFTDVRDVVKAYWMVANYSGDNPKVMNVCSGKGRKLSEVLDVLYDLAGKTFKVERDESRMRPSDVPVLIGDNTLITKELGWKPKILFEQTMEDLLNYWRGRV